MSRREDLWQLAAAALREGDDPLHVSFLSKHEVTLHEAYDLADDMALGLDLMASVMGKINSDYGLARQLGVMQLAEALIDSAQAGR